MVGPRSTPEERSAGGTQRGKRVELPKIERRLHDALDLATGKLATRVLVDALTAEARAKRLADLGFGGDPSVFVTPKYRLTPQEAWLDAFDGTYNAGPGVDQIWWRLPASFPTEFMPGCNFSFRQVPPGAVSHDPQLRSLAVPRFNRSGCHRHRCPAYGN